MKPRLPLLLLGAAQTGRGAWKQPNPFMTLAANGDCVRSAGVRECRSAALHGARKPPWLLLASGRP